jgi:amino acid transporter
VALLVQFAIGVIFVFMGQAGTSVKGAYDVMVSMTVIVYFIPYLFVFAAMIKLQGEPAGPEVIRVPGGKPVAKLVAVVGMATTIFTILVSVIPQPDEINKPLAVLKVVGGSLLLLLIGAGIYLVGKRKV